LATSVGSPSEPVIALAGEQVVAVWRQWLGSQRIHAAVSANGGTTWTSPRVLDSGAGVCTTPHLSMVGNRVVAVWSQQEGKEQYTAANCSTDGGNTWQTAQRLSSGAGPVDRPRAAMYGSQVVAVWVQSKTIVSRCSVDGGLTWTEPQTLSTGNGTVVDPSLAISGARVVAVWGQDDGAGIHLFASCSTDGGQHWLPPQPVENNPGKNHTGVSWAYYPQVAIAGEKAIATWCQELEGQRTVFVNHSADGGKTWGTAQSLGGTYFPRIAMSDTTAVTVWIAGSVLASYSTDGGATWQTPQMIEAGVRPADNPAVAISGSRVVAVWRQHDGTALSAFSNVSTNGGKTWETPQQMDTSSAMGWYPQVAVDGERAAALWMHLTLDAHWSVFANHSRDGGQSWQSPRVVASNAGDATAPSVALADTRAIMVWPCLEQERWVLRAAYSTDRGDSWRLSSLAAPCTSSGNSAALAGSRGVAVWRQADGIGAGSSVDGGATWQTTGLIAAGDLTSPAVAISENAAVGVWRRVTGGIEAGCSLDGGKTWTKPRSIVRDVDATEPQVAIAGRQVVATWLARTGIWAARSADGGKSWTKPQLLQSVIKIAGSPRVVMSGAQAVVVWQQHDGAANRIYASCSGDSGKTWGTAPVETGFGNAWGPTVSFVNGRILVIWRQREERALPLTEYSHLSMQNTQYGCFSADGGQTWSLPQIIRSGFGESVTPVLAIDGTHVLAGYVSHDGTLWTLSANTGKVGGLPP